MRNTRRLSMVWSPVLLAILALALGTMWTNGLPFVGPMTQPSPIAEPTLIIAEPSAIVQPAPREEAQAAADPVIEPLPEAAFSAVEAPAASAPALREPSAPGAKGARIGLQAGHWKSDEHADEMAQLRTSTGAAGSGWTEMDVNLDIAQRTAKLLVEQGYQVDILPSTVPVQYEADVFVSLHGDANNSSGLAGFKVARATRSAIPTVDDALVAAFNRTYGRITGQPRHDATITNNMRFYYAFAGSRFQHTVAPTTPAVILEMGFLTNAGDRRLLTSSPDLVAQAVAASIVDFLAQRQ